MYIVKVFKKENNAFVTCDFYGSLELANHVKEAVEREEPRVYAVVVGGGCNVI